MSSLCSDILKQTSSQEFQMKSATVERNYTKKEEVLLVDLLTPEKKVKNVFFKRDSQDAKTLAKDSNPFKKIENHLNAIVEEPEV